MRRGEGDGALAKYGSTEVRGVCGIGRKREEASGKGSGGLCSRVAVWCPTQITESVFQAEKE